jgi:DNA-directed RNA polymerase subunit beta'
MDKTAIKKLISRLIDHFRMTYTSHILDQLKISSFQEAIDTAISLGIDDLLTAPSKAWLIQDVEQQGSLSEKHNQYGNVCTCSGSSSLLNVEMWKSRYNIIKKNLKSNLDYNVSR